MDYLLKASAVLLLFYACYKLFLQRDTFFQANRWFLLSGLMAASCMPLIFIPNYIEYTPATTSYYTYTTNYAIAQIPEVVTEEPFDSIKLLIWMYVAGLLFFFGKLGVGLLSLQKVLKTGNIKTTPKFKLIETDKNIAPFSFFKHIVYSPNQFSPEELKHVINHEKVHAMQYHSIDIAIAQLFCILFWWNPFAWLYKKALQQNLEFIADQKAQYVSDCERTYQQVLLKTSVKNHQFAITNNFYTSLIKKRIVMLHKSKSNKINQLKMLFVIPLLGVFMMSFNTEDIYIEAQAEEESTAKVIQTETIEQIFNKDMSDNDLAQIKKELSEKGIEFNYSGIKRNNKGEITAIKTEFTHVEKSSNYSIKNDDGIKAFRFTSDKDGFSVGTIDKNINIKTQATGNKTYVIKTETDEDEDNNTTASNVQFISSKSPDTIYVKNGKGLSSWSSGDGIKTNSSISGHATTNVWVSNHDEPLFVVNGKIVKKSLFEDIDSDNIKSVNVLKGKSALEAFGDRGKNGVILLNTKGTGKWVIGDTFNVEAFEIDETNDSISHSLGETVYKKGNNTISYGYSSTKSYDDEPLYIIDETIISRNGFKLLDPNNIESVHIIKDKSAYKLYGEKGKNGVIVVTTKKPISGGNNIVVEVEENSPWKIATEVSSVHYFEDDNDTEVIEFIIVKTSTDTFLESQKANLKKHGIDAKFTKVRRNKSGEITSIKISLDDNQGRKSSASWKEKDEAIPDIVMGKSNDDTLYIRAIGH